MNQVYTFIGFDAIDYSDYSVERWVTEVATLNAALEPAAPLNERPRDELVALAASPAASSSSGAVAASTADARSSGAVASILSAFLGRCVDESPSSPYQSSGSSRTTGSNSAAAEGLADAYAFGARAGTNEAAGEGDGGEFKWACARCTFLNHPALPDCELCSSSRSLFPLQPPGCMTGLQNQSHIASADSIVPNST